MAEDELSIRYTDPSQAVAAIQQVATEIRTMLTPHEEVLYVALQDPKAPELRKDALVATTNRLIFYRRHALGRVDFVDWQWQDIKDVSIKQGLLASDVIIQRVDGETVTASWIHKEQAKRLYGISQQIELEWREKRRVREMEEARARAGGVQVSMPSGPPEPSRDDPVARLAKAKAMLDQGLISETEYETLKAKILSNM